MAVGIGVIFGAPLSVNPARYQAFLDHDRLRLTRFRPSIMV